MGGNALPLAKTRRYQADEYKELCAVINRLMFGFGYFIDWTVIDAYRTKESFGDMDILYTTYGGRPLDVDDIKVIFDNEPPKQIVRNTNVISCDFREFQIDFIHSPHAEYEYAKNYYAWNDIGNLIGKIARRFGMKHGHRGLTLPIRDGDNEFAEILLTTNHALALEFMDLDHTRFDVGFDTLNDIFEYVSASKYFNPEAYKLENVSHVGRVRDRKRKTYQEFLKYIDENQGRWNVLEMPAKQLMVPQVLDYFGKWPEFNTVVSKLAAQKQSKSKFNGDIVSRLTGLTGKDLGEFMKELRQTGRFTVEYMVYLPDDLIESQIMQYYEGFRK